MSFTFRQEPLGFKPWGSRAASMLLHLRFKTTCKEFRAEAGLRPVGDWV